MCNALIYDCTFNCIWSLCDWFSAIWICITTHRCFLPIQNDISVEFAITGFPSSIGYPGRQLPQLSQLKLFLSRVLRKSFGTAGTESLFFRVRKRLGDIGSDRQRESQNKSQYWPLDAPRGGFSTCGTDGRTDGRTDPLIEMRGRI